MRTLVCSGGLLLAAVSPAAADFGINRKLAAYSDPGGTVEARTFAIYAPNVATCARETGTIRVEVAVTNTKATKVNVTGTSNAACVEKAYREKTWPASKTTITATFELEVFERNAKPAGTPAPAAATKGLSADKIQPVILAKKEAIRSCSDASPTVTGSRTYVFTIKPDGSVSGAASKTPTTYTKKLDACIVKLLTKMKFPTATDETKVAYPLVFER